MRDGIELARRGVPAVALVTEAFWGQGDFVARSVGMPDAPRVRLPHPVAGTGRAEMTRVAADVLPQVLRALRGVSASAVDAGGGAPPQRANRVPS